MGLIRTHLYDFHRRHGKLTEFAGFEMPVWYEGIIPEHLAVRNALGIFDITHMGRCVIEGKDATSFLNFVLTRDAASMNIGQGRYSVMCNERGGIIDDLIVFRVHQDRFLMIYNAATRQKDYGWLTGHTQAFDVEIEDVSDEVPMFALQGPKAISALQSIANSDLASLRYYWGDWTTIRDFKVFVTRTGYTGEDGLEIFLWDTPLKETERAERLWQTILEAGREHGIKPCGLGARDTLRLEAGMCLYGNDIDEETTPLEAKLDFAVQLEKESFIGKEALSRQKAEGLRRVRVGFRALDRGIPRSGSEVIFEGKKVGYLTSGTFSPLLKCGIGMGYVPPDQSKVGTRLSILVRKALIACEVAEMPFYDIAKYGRRRQIA